jgi:hypothetical protein
MFNDNPGCTVPTLAGLRRTLRRNGNRPPFDGLWRKTRSIHGTAYANIERAKTDAAGVVLNRQDVTRQHISIGDNFTHTARDRGIRKDVRKLHGEPSWT